MAGEDERIINPTTIHPNLPVDGEYRITAVPNNVSVTPGAVVSYKCVYKQGGDPPAALRAGPGTMRDAITWYKFADGAINKNGNRVCIERGPVGPVEWNCTWEEKPGKYVIGCQIHNRTTDRKTWCFLGQRIVDVDSVLAPMLAQAREHGAAHPDEAVAHVNQLIINLRLAWEKFGEGDLKKKQDEFAAKQREYEAYFQDWEKSSSEEKAAKKSEHLARQQEYREYEAKAQGYKDHLKQQEEYLDRLQARLEPTKRFVRIPIHAVHLSYATQQRLQLNVFLTKVRTEAADVIDRPGGGWRRVPEKQVWKLVDWTDPTRPDMCHELEAKGESDEAAIRSLFSDWDSYGNRYPEGKLAYEARVGPLTIGGSFETNGKTTWDFISGALGCIALLGLLVTGAATLIAPVMPMFAKAAAYAFWGSIFSSTAAAVINITQRLDQGFGTWKDYAFDGLTIVGNLLAGVGQVARVAQVGKEAAWARGATIRWTDQSGRVLKYTLIGQVGNDLIQGVLVAVEEMKEYDAIMQDKTLSPRERVDRLLVWVHRVGTSGLMLYISVRSTKNDIDNLNQKNQYLGAGGGGGSNGKSGGKQGGSTGGKPDGATGGKSGEGTSGKQGDDTGGEQLAEGALTALEEEGGKPGEATDGKPGKATGGNPGGSTDPKAGDATGNNQGGATGNKSDNAAGGKTEMRDPLTGETKPLNTEQLETNDLHVAPPKEKLDALADPKQEIELRRNVPVEGHTDPGKAKDQTSAHETTVHETKAQTELDSAQHRQSVKPSVPDFKDKFPKDSNIWRINKVKENHIRLQRKPYGYEDDPRFEYDKTKDLVFSAEIDSKGFITVHRIETYVKIDGKTIQAPDFRAKELYQMMFKHFEENSTFLPIRGIKSEFAEDNYYDVMGAMERLPLDEAVKEARTWKYWQEFLDTRKYELEKIDGFPRHMKGEDKVQWRYKLKKKE